MQTARKLLAALQQLARTDPSARPSVRELAAQAGLSPDSVCTGLYTLEHEFGYIERLGPHGRNVRLVEHTY